MDSVAMTKMNVLRESTTVIQMQFVRILTVPFLVHVKVDTQEMVTVVSILTNALLALTIVAVMQFVQILLDHSHVNAE